MERVPQLVRRGKKDRRMGAPSELDWEAIEALRTEMRVELIQELIPLGLAEVGRVLDEEVERLAGPRHARKGEGEVIYRHGSNPGSVRLGGQRHPVRVPRVRGLEGEARLESYERLHWAAGEVDEGLFRKVLLGISCRDYEAAVEAVPGAIGLSKSTVSREFKKATARQLKVFQERELTELDVVALGGWPFAAAMPLRSELDTRSQQQAVASPRTSVFIDTDYNEESFFVRHAYFLGANDPYKALKTTLRAEIDPDAWATLRSNVSRPFSKPESGRIAVKVINHLGDEAMRVFPG